MKSIRELGEIVMNTETYKSGDIFTSSQITPTIARYTEGKTAQQRSAVVQDIVRHLVGLDKLRIVAGRAGDRSVCYRKPTTDMLSKPWRRNLPPSHPINRAIQDADRARWSYR